MNADQQQNGNDCELFALLLPQHWSYVLAKIQPKASWQAEQMRPHLGKERPNWHYLLIGSEEREDAEADLKLLTLESDVIIGLTNTALGATQADDLLLSVSQPEHESST